MKNLVLTVILTLLIAVGGNPTFGQTKKEIDELLKLLNENKYGQLVNKVSVMREKEYYKNAFMDYCLAYGYCRLNMPDVSREWFNHILKSYNTISIQKESELIQLRNECSAPQVALSPTFTMVNYLSSMSSEGFEGNAAGIESKMGVPSLSDRVSEIDFENAKFDATNRQFAIDEKDRAWNYYKNLMSGGPGTLTHKTTDHLLVIYSAGNSAIEPQIQELERYYRYYQEEFGIGSDDRLITVFYFNGRAEFDRGTTKLHNIKVPSSTFGYASSADLVLTGIASASWLGALKHELFHLMVRSSIGDISPWMDEGIACLFESSSLNSSTGKASFNMNNYRSEILKRLDMIRGESGQPLPLPSVNDFINFSWLDFSGRPGDLTIKAGIHYSISYVFVKYLYDKGKLKAVIDAYRDRTFTETVKSGSSGDEDITIIHVKPANQIIEETMLMTMDQIQKDFELWCSQKLGNNPYK